MVQGASEGAGRVLGRTGDGAGITIGRSPSPYIRASAFSGLVRETRTIWGNFKTSFLRNQNESEAENRGPDVSGHGNSFEINFIFYI